MTKTAKGAVLTAFVTPATVNLVQDLPSLLAALLLVMAATIGFSLASADNFMGVTPPAPGTRPPKG